MKKIFFSVIFCLMLSSQAFAQTWNIGYPNAENVTATFSGNTLTISGIGAMQDFGYYTTPWSNIQHNIVTLIIEEGVTTIGDYAFFYFRGLNCSLSLPESITTIGDNAFSGCFGLNGSLNLPEGITTIGYDAFFWCEGFSGLLNIPESLTTIGHRAFHGCIGLNEMNVNASNENYSSENGILYNKNKTTLILCPGNKTGAINISNGVKIIEDGAFFFCENISSLSIPNSITSFGASAFANCTGLISVINFASTPQNISTDAFIGLTLNDIILYVPAGSKEAYQNPTYGWQDFNIIEIPNISEDNIIFTPSENSALIEWQPVENAEGYRIIIYNDEARTNIICTLEFDATGELVSVSRARSAMQTASTSISHTINNLPKDTYYYTFEVLGVGNAVLASLSGTFDTGTTSVAETQYVASLPKIVGYYSITGTKLPKEPASGIYIILYDNRKAEKVVK